jgi:hypothetical protein
VVELIINGYGYEMKIRAVKGLLFRDLVVEIKNKPLYSFTLNYVLSWLV